MTKDEIIAMARQSGFDTYKNETARVEGYDCTEELERFAALVAAKEREACAQVCNTTYYQFIGPEFGEVRHGIAACSAAISARGKP